MSNVFISHGRETISIVETQNTVKHVNVSASYFLVRRTVHLKCYVVPKVTRRAYLNTECWAYPRSF